MTDSIDTTQTESQAPEFDDGLPEGGHAVEVAARAGFGPLSPLGQDVWHGQSVPCVSCGQLVHRDATGCEHCGQDLAEDMIQKMRQHAGPWFVLEHVRPFPGVSLDRVIRQIRRGLITETSIVRGPSNDYQWRFAVETPGLCRYFGKCWCCHAEVTLADAYCAQCLHYLSFEKPRASAQMPASIESRPAETTATMQAPVAHPIPQSVASASRTASIDGRKSPLANSQTDNRQSTIANPQIDNRQSTIAITRQVAAGGPNIATASRPPESPDLARLSAVVRQARASRRDSDWDAPPKVGGVNVAWIAALLIVGAIVALLLISRARSTPAQQASPSLPTMNAPIRTPMATPVAPATSAPIGTAPSTNPPPPQAESAPTAPATSPDAAKPVPVPVPQAP